VIATAAGTLISAMTGGSIGKSLDEANHLKQDIP
jgi:hypothetical protein